MTHSDECNASLTPSETLSPVPIVDIAKPEELAELNSSKLHLGNLDPIDNLDHLALQVAMLTGDVAELFNLIAELRTWTLKINRLSPLP